LEEYGFFEIEGDGFVRIENIDAFLNQLREDFEMRKGLIQVIKSRMEVGESLTELMELGVIEREGSGELERKEDNLGELLKEEFPKEWKEAPGLEVE